MIKKLPWKWIAGTDGSSDIVDDTNAIICSGVDHSLAPFIIECVNNHDDLCEALNKMVDSFNFCSDVDIRKIEKVISKVEGGK